MKSPTWLKKEMYTFEDRNGDSLTLRPEGTAGCVRAGIEHGLLYNQEQRLWYIGPMFRHERPQKGRYRQFHQLGLRSFTVCKDLISTRTDYAHCPLVARAGISEHVTLELNSYRFAGSSCELPRCAVAFLEQHKEKTGRRLQTPHVH